MTQQPIHSLDGVRMCLTYEMLCGNNKVVCMTHKNFASIWLSLSVSFWKYFISECQAETLWRGLARSRARCFFIGTQNKIPKRGLPYLRKAIWTAANRPSFCEPVLSDYYQSLKSKDKYHLSVLS